MSRAPSYKYEIGIAEIDAQHSTLFVILEKLQKCGGSGYTYQAARDALVQMTHYANVHFAIEESLMRMHGYPETVAHIAEHERFREELTEFQRGMLDPDIVTKLHNFIQAWLANHIDITDRKYVPHLLKSTIDPTAR